MIFAWHTNSKSFTVLKHSSKIIFIEHPLLLPEGINLLNKQSLPRYKEGSDMIHQEILRLSYSLNINMFLLYTMKAVIIYIVYNIETLGGVSRELLKDKMEVLMGRKKF